MEAQMVDRCIRHEGKYRTVGVYVVVVMDGECPVEVGVSLAFGKDERLVDQKRITEAFAMGEKMTNASLKVSLTVSSVIRMLKTPPCEMSGIIGDALCASLEG